MRRSEELWGSRRVVDGRTAIRCVHTLLYRVHCVILGMLVGLFFAASGVEAQEPGPGPGAEHFTAKPPPRTGEQAQASIRELAPPPPPLHDAYAGRYAPAPEPPSTLPWLIAGFTSLGMVLTTAWGFYQRNRAKVVGEELSRIRIHRSSSLRVTAPLGAARSPEAEPPVPEARPRTRSTNS